MPELLSNSSCYLGGRRHGMSSDMSIDTTDIQEEGSKLYFIVFVGEFTGFWQAGACEVRLAIDYFGELKP